MVEKRDYPICIAADLNEIVLKGFYIDLIVSSGGGRISQIHSIHKQTYRHK